MIFICLRVWGLVVDLLTFQVQSASLKENFEQSTIGQIMIVLKVNVLKCGMMHNCTKFIDWVELSQLMTLLLNNIHVQSTHQHIRILFTLN